MEKNNSRSSLVREIREVLLQIGSPMPFLIASAMAVKETTIDSPVIFLFGLLLAVVTLVIFFSRCYTMFREEVSDAWSQSVPNDDLDAGSSIREIFREWWRYKNPHPPITERESSPILPHVIYGLCYFVCSIFVYLLFLVLAALVVEAGYFRHIVAAVEHTDGEFLETLSIVAESALGGLVAILLHFLPDLGTKTLVFLTLILAAPSIPLLFAIRNLTIASEEVHSRIILWFCRHHRPIYRIEFACLVVFSILYGILLGRI